MMYRRVILAFLKPKAGCGGELEHLVIILKLLKEGCGDVGILLKCLIMGGCRDKIKTI